MDKNNIIGAVLIAAVFIGYSVYSQPSKEEKAAAARQDSIENVARKNAENAAKLAAQQKVAQAQAAAEADTTALFHSALKGKATNVVLKNKSVELTLNTKGGVVSKAVIKNFTDYKGNQNVTLFDSNSQSLNFALAAKDVNINTSDLYFTPSNQTDSTVTMTATAGNGKELVINYVLGGDYMLHAQLQTVGMAGDFAPSVSQMDVQWKDMCRQQERGFTFENRYASLTYHKVDGGTDYLSEAKSITDENIEKKIDWVAFKNQFFSAVMIAKNNFAENSLMTSVPQEKGSGNLKQYEAKMKTFFDPSGKTPSEFDFYFGPNDFRLLKRVEAESTFGKDLEMQRLVYLGWPLFRIINRWFTIYVFDFLTGLNINMGIVLILITMLLKFITYPMVKKSYMSSAKMRVLKPKLEEATKHLNKPEDQMQKQQAMMMEYSKYGVSPMAGCLPMLIQMPIWIAMFNFVPNAIELRQQGFLWADDLSTYDSVWDFGTNVWGIGDHLSLFCLLFCATNFIYSFMTIRQQRESMSGEQAQQMKMMQWMMYLMPVMFFFMFNRYSSGLNYYYFISLLASSLTMWYLRKRTDDAKLLEKLEANYQANKNNPNKKAKGLAARFENMQKLAEQMNAERNNAANKH